MGLSPWSGGKSARRRGLKTRKMAILSLALIHCQGFQPDLADLGQLTSPKSPPQRQGPGRRNRGSAQGEPSAPAFGRVLERLDFWGPLLPTPLPTRRPTKHPLSTTHHVFRKRREHRLVRPTRRLAHGRALGRGGKLLWGLSEREPDQPGGRIGLTRLGRTSVPPAQFSATGRNSEARSRPTLPVPRQQRWVRAKFGRVRTKPVRPEPDWQIGQTLDPARTKLPEFDSFRTTLGQVGTMDGQDWPGFIHVGSMSAQFGRIPSNLGLGFDQLWSGLDHFGIRLDVGLNVGFARPKHGHVWSQRPKLGWIRPMWAGIEQAWARFDYTACFRANLCSLHCGLAQITNVAGLAKCEATRCIVLSLLLSRSLSLSLCFLVALSIRDLEPPLRRATKNTGNTETRPTPSSRGPKPNGPLGDPASDFSPVVMAPLFVFQMSPSSRHTPQAPLKTTRGGLVGMACATCICWDVCVWRRAQNH